MSTLPVPVQTVLLLTLSNVFMTFAWYAHLKDLAARPWWIAALVSWGVAVLRVHAAGAGEPDRIRTTSRCRS